MQTTRMGALQFSPNLPLTNCSMTWDTFAIVLMASSTLVSWPILEIFVEMSVMSKSFIASTLA